MSKIRSRAELNAEMSAEFAWRKKELHNLKVIVHANKNTHNRELCVRAAITLLYAHWEGFVKRVGSCYLEYVARKKLKHDELSSSFLASAVSGLVHGASASSKIQPCLDLVEFFRSNSGSPSKINWKSGVHTKANLKASVFCEIVTTLGLDYSRFATKEKLIDEKLLNNRNNIAHGQYSLVDLDEYLALHDEVLAMMQDFYNQIENAAYTGAYRRPSR